MPAQRSVFLDRDGVINRKPPVGDYIRTWSEFQFLPGIADWIQLFNALGLLVIVVTNQRGVALGLIRCEDLEEIHRNMTQEPAPAPERVSTTCSAAPTRKQPATAGSPSPAWCWRRSGSGISTSPTP